MKKQFFTLIFGLALCAPLSSYAQSTGSWLPDAGVKSSYSAPAVPTTLQPVETSMADLMKEQNFHVVTTSNYGNAGLLFTLKHSKDMILCILDAPAPGSATDQNVPTSRCWKLD